MPATAEMAPVKRRRSPAESGTVGRKKRFQDSSYEAETTVVTVRMTREYAAWLERLCDHERIRKSDVIDRALVLYAKSLEFEPPPKR